VLGEYPDCGTFDPGSSVEQIGRDSLDGISMSQELRLPRGTQRALHAGQFVHRSVTDLTFNRLAVVEHRKPKRQSFEVISQDFASRERHRHIPWRFARPRFSLIDLSRKWLRAIELYPRAVAFFLKLLWFLTLLRSSQA
jgi:hypothetical protein